MKTKPNIIFILIDDMGCKDLSCYGSTFYETPNIDRLFRDGMHFTDAYAACPVCSPTRASLLTGKYPANIGVTNYIKSENGTGHLEYGRLISAPYVDHLPLEEVSLAQTLKHHGYQTWHVGKWHLGDESYGPEKHGFDLNIGGCHWGQPRDTYFSPWSIPPLVDADVPDGTYLTDYLTDQASDLIAQKGDKPFFLNLWYYSVHTPIQAKAEKIRKYEAKARRLKLDQVPALVRGERLNHAGIHHEHVQRRVIQSDPVYAAMIESLDENIGRLLAMLEACQQLENTLIVFTSDNGGLSSAEGSPTCNAPLAEGKGWMYEGGVREPLIAHWPGQIRPGSSCSTPVTSPDLYPTLLDMIGAPLLPQQHVDGISLKPLLKEEGQVERDALFWHFPHYGNQGGSPGASIRMGDWKLIEFFEDETLELYYLRDDISEVHDLSSSEPQRVKLMQERLHAWQEAMNAKYPVPNVNGEAGIELT